jgi:hypothetical protein
MAKAKRFQRLTRVSQITQLALGYEVIDTYLIASVQIQ